MKTQLTAENFIRTTNDVNGNPRYVVHFLAFIALNDNSSIEEKYTLAVKRAKLFGGKKYHNKKYGGGVVFQSYNLPHDIDKINAFEFLD